MIASTIGAAVLAIVAYFVVAGTRATLKSTSVNQNNMDQWAISSRLMVDSRMANGLAIYDELVASDIENDKRIKVKNTPGNLLVFTLSTPDTSSSSSRAPVYQRLIGYVYKTTTKALYKFDYTVPASEKSPPQSLETILKSNLSSFNLVEIANGVAPINTNQRVFYFLNDNYATIALSTSEGALGSVKDSKLIEVAFIVRK